MEFKFRQVIEISWWTNEDIDTNRLHPNQESELTARANNHIAKQRAEGYTSGELSHSLNIDGQETQFTGYWSMNTLK